MGEENKMRTKVSVARCESYEQDKAHAAMEKVLGALGGIGGVLGGGKRVIVKPNLLMAKRPEDAITTHPVLVEALCRQIIAAGGHPVIADSPGGPLSVTLLKRIYRLTGMEEAAKKTGAELNFNLEFKEVPQPEGKVARRVRIMKCVLEADAVVSFAKLKTHGMMLFTGAVKNMFGTVPGLVKGEYHFNMPRIEDFSDMLVDICTLVRPALSIIDGVVGMEGEGPSSGRPVQTGVILASENPYALDYAAAAMVGIRPERVPTVSRAAERGLFAAESDGLDIVGDMARLCCVKNYDTPTIVSASFTRGKYPAFIENMVNRAVQPKPVFMHQICTGCGDCNTNCPAGAIEMVDGRPILKPDKCIRCFCCQELCYQKAVSIYRPWLLRALGRGR
jgi:uncharacterized protein (DUF362 family)/Pyruvate/2-oxoacid:ferredoxin oxidoreductase delta subunit